MFLARSFAEPLEPVQKSDGVVTDRPFVQPVQQPTGFTSQKQSSSAASKMEMKKATQPVEATIAVCLANIPNRITDSHREASALRLVTHETHTVASHKQLEGTTHTTKGDPHSQVTAPTSEMVAGGEQCAHRSTITPTKPCSANLYRRINGRAGYSLKRVHCKGRLIPSRKQTTHKLSGTKGGLSGP